MEKVKTQRLTLGAHVHLDRYSNEPEAYHAFPERPWHRPPPDISDPLKNRIPQKNGDDYTGNEG
jgi:hypothetical protein